MGAVGEESLEMLFRLGDGIRPRHADDIKALFARLCDKAGLERRRIAQKSRLA